MDESKVINNEERDGLAFALLQRFISEGFMAPDVDAQVRWAYKYADSILRFREHGDQTITIPNCPKCHAPMERRNVGTFDDPGQTIFVCTNCTGD